VNYEKYVAAIASDRMQELKQAPTTGPCSVHIVARMEIPKSWPKKKQALAESNEISPGKPDLDNIAKTVLDALNGVCYEDDAQVVILSVTKCYSREPGVMVRVD
jgi:Holliday junction resolvase RusA-like endonuclease